MIMRNFFSTAPKSFSSSFFFFASSFPAFFYYIRPVWTDEPETQNPLPHRLISVYPSKLPRFVVPFRCGSPFTRRVQSICTNIACTHVTDGYTTQHTKTTAECRFQFRMFSIMPGHSNNGGRSICRGHRPYNLFAPVPSVQSWQSKNSPNCENTHIKKHLFLLKSAVDMLAGISEQKNIKTLLFHNNSRMDTTLVIRLLCRVYHACNVTLSRRVRHICICWAVLGWPRNWLRM